MSHPITSKLLYAGGLIATAASIKGSYAYILTETNNDLAMAASAAVGLGAIAYVGWEVAFNHKGLAKRAAALIIAVAAASVSTYTIYQGNLYPTLQAAQAEASAKTKAAEDQQQEAYNSARKAYQQQQSNLQNSIDALSAQNTRDTQAIDQLQQEEKPAKTTLTNLRRSIETRNTQIIELNKQLSAITAPVAPVATPTPATPITNHAINWPLLARSGLYEAMVALALLFGSWFRSARAESDAQLITQLQHVTAQAQLQATLTADKYSELVLALNTAQDLKAELQQQAASINQQSAERLTALANNLAQTGQVLKLSKASYQELTTLTEQAQTKGKELKLITEAAITNAQTVSTRIIELTQLQAQLQTTTQTANATLANASNLFVGANKTANAPTNTPANATKPKMTVEQVVSLLSQRLINPNADDLITTDSIMEATGLGRTLAEKALSEALNQGILERLPRGRGFSHRYAKHDTSNVLPLRRA